MSDLSSTVNPINVTSFQYTFLTVQGVTLWSRVKVALSIALTPFTLIFLGKSIRVTCRAKKEKKVAPKTAVRGGL